MLCSQKKIHSSCKSRESVRFFCAVLNASISFMRRTLANISTRTNCVFGRLVLLLAQLSLILSTAHSQSATAIFKQLSVKDGLSQTTVRCIMQDTDGYLWFGTNDGLNKYDGYSFKILRNDPLDSTSIPYHNVQVLSVDHKGNMWVGTRFGLGVILRGRNGGKNYFTKHSDSSVADSFSITAITEDRDGSLWLGTPRGLIHLNPATDQMQRYIIDPRDSTKKNFVHHILLARDGGLWFVTADGGLNYFNREKKSIDRYFFKGKSNQYISLVPSFKIVEDTQGLFWMASGQSLLRFDRRSKQFASYLYEDLNPQDRLNNVTQGIAIDSSGNFWIGINEKGILKFDPSTSRFTKYQNEKDNTASLSDNYVLDIFVDRAGSVWIGTKRGGINYFDQQHNKFSWFTLHPTSADRPDMNYIISICAQRNGDLWVASQNGFGHFNKNMSLVKLYTPKQRNAHGLKDYRIRGMFEDRYGKLWFGSSSDGVYRYDSTRDRFINYRAEKNGDHRFGNATVSLTADSVHTILVTTSGGLYTIDETRRALIPVIETSKQGQEIYKAYLVYTLRDRSGLFWIAHTGGVIAYDQKNDSIRHYKHDRSVKRSLSFNYCWSLFLDSRGRVWVCTTVGLNRYEPNTDNFTIYTEQEGLPNNCIYGMLEDRNGHLWMSTNRGLSRFDPRTERFRNFDSDDGLQSEEFNQNAFARSEDGTLYFGGINGFNAFRPEQITDNPFIPPVVLSSMKVMEKEMLPDRIDPRGGEIELNYNQTVFSFEFVALSFSDPHKNRYAYKMEGLSDDWVHCGKQRFVSYANLSPGDYVFRIKACNNDGVWNEEGIAVRIHILPPPWKTWWAYLSYVVIIGGIVIAIVKYRERRVLEIEHIRLLIAADLHDDIGSGLTRITLMSDAMHRQYLSIFENASETLQIEKLHSLGNSLRESMQRVSAISRELVENMSDVVWSIDPRNDSLGKLLLRIKSFAIEVCEQKDIQLNYSSPATLESIMIGSDVSRGLLLVSKEALNNIVKHAECSNVSICFEHAHHRITLRIEDDGRGFDEHMLQRINGLQNMRARVKKAGGTIEISSTPNQGTRIKAVFSQDGKYRATK